MVARDKYNNNHHRGEALKPSVRDLLKTIERAPETTYNAIGNRVARRWLHVNLLAQLAIKKIILHIKLRDRSVTNRSNIKESANSGHVSHWSKGLIIVATLLLLKTARHKTSFVVFKTTIGASLDHVDPLSQDWTNKWRGNNIPSVNALQRINLLGHR
jgi:hypothetical protein